MSQDRSFIKSGRNTIIHKEKKLDLVIVNSETQPKIKWFRTIQRRTAKKSPRSKRALP